MNQFELDIAQYEFDTLGFCRIKNLISKDLLEKIKNLLDLIEKNNYTLPNTDVILGNQREDGTAFISNILDASDYLQEIAFNQRVLDLLTIFMNAEFKLNHSNAIISRAGSTYPHMAGYPIHNKAFYHSRGGKILSSLTKLVIPITNNKAEDGGFAAIKGSHKSEYPIPYPPRSTEEYNLLEHIEIPLGDAILFSEAMTHGSLSNKSGKCRRMIFFCYSMSYMPEWQTQNLVISDRFIKKVSLDNRKYLR